MSAESLRKDSEELIRLSQLTESVNVKRILATEAEKLKQLAEREASAASAAPKVKSTAGFTSKIVNYAWDQSDKFLKIYVTLNGVHTFPPENISTEFSEKSFELRVAGPDRRNSLLAITNLLHKIVPSECYHKVKTDMVSLYIKKASPEHWSYVTEAEKKAKEPKTPKFEKEEDPGASLMTLMKQMYDDGDDEMKRTIAKAWTEARDKKGDEIPM